MTIFRGKAISWASSDIYSMVMLVRVWLGPLEWPSRVFDPLKTILSYTELTHRWALSKGNAALSEFRDIVFASYWTHIWIAQEYVLARKVVILCTTQNTAETSRPF
ncbi:hypothetical protein BDZ45DRAFT_736663 [Acephala macrosclerotiorum]|nr:hypothetical protein BDZ45DRAFT_736663 [Acephala macrosclerotiorum]